MLVESLKGDIEKTRLRAQLLENIYHINVNGISSQIYKLLKLVRSILRMIHQARNSI